MPIDPTVEGTSYTFPSLLTAKDQRVTDGGLPTAGLLRWEQATRDRFNGIVVDLSKRVTQVAGDFGDVAGTVEHLSEVVEDPDTGLVHAVDQVKAELQDAAGGEVSLSARLEVFDGNLSTATTDIATLSGDVITLGNDVSDVSGDVAAYALQYSVVGTLNGVTGGYQLTGVQKLDGSVSYDIEFLVNNFKIFDPTYGTAVPVFSYSSTLNRFVFNAPVYIGETEIGAGASNDFHTISYTGVSQSGTGSTSNAFPAGSYTVTVATKTAVLVSGFVQFTVSGTGGAQFAVFVRLNGANVVTAFSTYGIPFQANNTLNNIPQAFQGSFVLPAGTHTIDVWWQYVSASPGVTLTFASQAANVFLFRNVT